MTTKTKAADSFDEIRAAMNRIAEMAKPMCPIISTRTLHDCLRSTARCSTGCPNYSDWIGPQSS